MFSLWFLWVINISLQYWLLSLKPQKNYHLTHQFSVKWMSKTLGSIVYLSTPFMQGDIHVSVLNRIGRCIGSWLGKFGSGDTHSASRGTTWCSTAALAAWEHPGAHRCISAVCRCWYVQPDTTKTYWDNRLVTEPRAEQRGTGLRDARRKTRY